MPVAEKLSRQFALLGQISKHTTSQTHLHCLSLVRVFPWSALFWGSISHATSQGTPALPGACDVVPPAGPQHTQLERRHRCGPLCCAPPVQAVLAAARTPLHAVLAAARSCFAGACPDRTQAGGLLDLHAQAGKGGLAHIARRHSSHR